MSHLINEVSGNSADREGDVIAPAIDDLSNVSFTSLTANQSLKYDGSNWVNSVVDTFDYVSHFRTNGATRSSLNGYTYPPPFYMDANNYLFARVIISGVVLMYETDIANNDIQTNRHVGAAGTAEYCKGFTIKAGVRALLSADVVCEGTNSTAYRDVRWSTTGGTALGPIMRVQVLSGKNRNTVWGYIDASVDTDVALRMTAGSGTIGFNQDTATRENVFVIAKKVQS